MTAKNLSSIIAIALLSGCAAAPVMQPSAEFAVVRPTQEQPDRIPTGSILDNSRRMSLFEGQRHWNVGDLVTIILAETTQASRTAGLSADRAASNDVLNTADMAGKVLAQGGFIGALKKDGGNISHDATGSASQAASLQGSITASVVEVLPNGNLVVTGEKQLALSEGSEFIQVTGVIRAQDIQPDNTVASRRIANAQISYRGTGELARAAKPGWGTSLLYNLWPF